MTRANNEAQWTAQKASVSIWILVHKPPLEGPKEASRFGSPLFPWLPTLMGPDDARVDHEVLSLRGSDARTSKISSQTPALAQRVKRFLWVLYSVAVALGKKMAPVGPAA